ncbi:Clustered mitochondria [Neolecta irregularis DAH-3]|uniref:Clustered mitochondria protein homolog n=1 Tax=Neolecta irregularis (strain DAH-3) TaxID=1198029 RepID=A0A1U7LU00_NEOID|nr:Clustered mitochondria [Neolecta irregularis DAH-3]|eukprot:OLL26155.1 Clustered mitochondria [Neolecta irregularis DAH-3]
MTAEEIQPNGILDKPSAESQSLADGTFQHQEQTYALTIKFPRGEVPLKIMAGPHELLHDIKQSILEYPTHAIYSCFHLEINGKTMNEFIELKDLSEVTQQSELTLVEDPYNERDARHHVYRLRELMGLTQSYTDAGGISAGLSHVETVIKSTSFPCREANYGDVNQEEPLSGFDLSQPPSLTSFIPQYSEPTPQCVKLLSVSNWNPPPQHLRSKGHLLYLQVTTLEGEQYHITSHIGGFYVSKSNNVKFDPSPRLAPKDFAAYTLNEVLSNLSPGFSTGLAKITEQNQSRDPLTHVSPPNVIPASSWLVHIPAITADAGRSQETYLTSGINGIDSLRDWNEEIQSARELPRGTFQERILRERVLQKTLADFTEAAARGAQLVIHGEVQSLNPNESFEAQLYVYGGIFFSRAIDGTDTFKAYGGHEAAHAAVGKDVVGVRLLNTLDLEGVAILATVLIDYLGDRLVAQSVVPGIFRQREEGDQQIVYGGIDGHDKVATNEDFHELLKKVAEATHVKLHPVWDKEGYRKELWSSIETKGLSGSDGRKYILDLYRLTPLDIEWIEREYDNSNYPHRVSVLRPELFEPYWQIKLKEYMREQCNKVVFNTNGEPMTIEDTPADDTPQVDGKISKQNLDSQPLIDIKKFRKQYKFNTDAFSGQIPQTDEEKAELKKDEELVRNLSLYLRNHHIPAYIKSFENGSLPTPIDGAALSTNLHRRGINMRYLGIIADLAKSKKTEPLKVIAIQEMVARATKHVFGRIIRGLPRVVVPYVLSHLLNCLFGDQVNLSPNAESNEMFKTLYRIDEYDFTRYTSESLRDSIAKEVQIRFRYNVTENLPVTRPLQLLREICLKLGIQLKAQEYQFQMVHEQSQMEQSKTNENGKTSKRNGETPVLRKTIFVPEDILNIVPIVKHTNGKSTIAEETLAAGRTSIFQNQQQLGMEVLIESMTIHEQIYGVIHPDVARCFSQIAAVYNALDEKEAACELGRKALIISERTLGVDHNETIQLYISLAMYENSAGRTANALALLRHVYGYWRIIYGDDHPEAVTFMGNIANILQNRKEFQSSVTWFQEALRICNVTIEEKSVITATIFFQLSQTLAMIGEYKESINKMRSSLNIFSEVLGEDHENTKEANHWLQILTQNAVIAARQTKELQARKLRRTRIVLPSKQAEISNPVPNTILPNQGNRSIEDLVRYIGGNDGITATSKTIISHPKKRHGRK